MSSSVLTAFVGSLQASMSVLLTISYGVLAAQFKLITESSAKDISKACVFIFLPALLIHNVGSQLRLETAANYVPILSISPPSLLQGVTAIEDLLNKPQYSHAPQISYPSPSGRYARASFSCRAGSRRPLPSTTRRRCPCSWCSRSTRPASWPCWTTRQTSSSAPNHISSSTP